MKKIIVIASAVIMMTLLLAACGNSGKATPDSATPDSAVSSTEKETTKVIETTSQGGSIEKDKEGNVIEKDKDGTIVSVKDKDGKTIEITEYITTHTYIVDGGSSDTSSAASGSDKHGESEKEDKPAEKETIPEDFPREEYELPII